MRFFAPICQDKPNSLLFVLRNFIILTIIMFMLSGCGSQTAAQETEMSAVSQPPKHQVVVYFPGWKVDDHKNTPNCEVISLPWDKITCVNYAFWEVAPTENPEQTSLERVKEGLGARTSFRVASNSDFSEQMKLFRSRIDPKLPIGHFPQFAAMSQKYPQVTILISVGGWNRCGFFSEMAYTREGRASFIQSCVEMIQEYPWIDGFDLDWEYPATANRKPALEDPGDQGCPIFGTKEEDRENFTLLVSEFRQALDEAFGAGEKWLTACAAGTTTYALPSQDWAEVSKSLNLINLMTYDLTDLAVRSTQHASSAADSEKAARYLLDLGIPSEKICIGSPLYGTGFAMADPKTMGLSVEAEPGHSQYHGISLSSLLPLLENAASGYALRQENGRFTMGEAFDRGTVGFHVGYDAEAGGAYAWCDDPDSPYYMQFFSFEDPLSLQAKLDSIRRLNLGGIIVWESTQDTDDYAMITQMAQQLNQP